MRNVLTEDQGGIERGCIHEMARAQIWRDVSVTRAQRAVERSARLAKADDHFAARVPRGDVVNRLRDGAQPLAPIDDRRERPRGHELGDQRQGLPD